MPATTWEEEVTVGYQQAVRASFPVRESGRLALNASATGAARVLVRWLDGSGVERARMEVQPAQPQVRAEVEVEMSSGATQWTVDVANTGNEVATVHLQAQLLVREVVSEKRVSVATFFNQFDSFARSATVVLAPLSSITSPALPVPITFPVPPITTSRRLPRPLPGRINVTLALTTITSRSLEPDVEYLRTFGTFVLGGPNAPASQNIQHEGLTVHLTIRFTNARPALTGTVSVDVDELAIGLDLPFSFLGDRVRLVTPLPAPEVTCGRVVVRPLLRRILLRARGVDVRKEFLTGLSSGIASALSSPALGGRLEEGMSALLRSLADVDYSAVQVRSVTEENGDLVFVLVQR